MENIIKKAIEGWFVYTKDHSQNSVDYLVKIYAENQYQVVCNPLFWQALGKACGWHYITKKWRCENPDCRYSKDEDFVTVLESYCSNCGVKKSSFNFEQKEWLKNAQKFHEINLTEGWDAAVSYLSEQIK